MPVDEAVGHDTAGRPAADDDVVEGSAVLVRAHASSLPSLGFATGLGHAGRLVNHCPQHGLPSGSHYPARGKESDKRARTGGSGRSGDGGGARHRVGHGHAERTPFGRWGRPEEVARVIAFLAHPDSGFVTGVVWPVDGGFSMRGDPGEDSGPRSVQMP
ncbi:MAG: SDR family oxidoreductase [Geminicoccaceae bacterium]|nr:SDR family oxidoreductase [Geminicoccaceae bacterium]